MKTKEEILEDNKKCYKHGWCITGDIHYTLDEAALNAMDIYAAQEVERAKVETCKWHINKVHEFIGKPGCQANKQRLFGLSYQYCPFCGKKIERV